jgi:hypothetical protein
MSGANAAACTGDNMKWPELEASSKVPGNLGWNLRREGPAEKGMVVVTLAVILRSYTCTPSTL